MARRSDHSREEVKEMLINAGYELIKANGYSKFSARKVAVDIGYTVGTIYNIFDSHDRFILNINAKTIDLWYEELQQLLAANNNNISLFDLAKFYIDYSITHYNEWMALFEHTMSPNIQIPDWYIAKLRRFFELVESMVEPYVNNDQNKARRTARVLWAGIHGISILSISNKLDLVEAESAHILAKSFVDHYLQGMQNE